MNFPKTAVDIIKTWKTSPDIQAKYGTLSAYESVCRWHTDPQLKQEFRSFEAYDAFIRASAAGKVAILH